MVVNFRVNHAPLVLTRETREMQENGTPAKCSLCYCSNRKGLQAAARSATAYEGAATGDGPGNGENFGGRISVREYGCFNTEQSASGNAAWPQ